MLLFLALVTAAHALAPQYQLFSIDPTRLDFSGHQLETAHFHGTKRSVLNTPLGSVKGAHVLLLLPPEQIPEDAIDAPVEIAAQEDEPTTVHPRIEALREKASHLVSQNAKQRTAKYDFEGRFPTEMEGSGEDDHVAEVKDSVVVVEGVQGIEDVEFEVEKTTAKHNKGKNVEKSEKSDKDAALEHPKAKKSSKLFDPESIKHKKKDSVEVENRIEDESSMEKLVKKVEEKKTKEQKEVIKTPKKKILAHGDDVKKIEKVQKPHKETIEEFVVRMLEENAKKLKARNKTKNSDNKKTNKIAVEPEVETDEAANQAAKKGAGKKKPIHLKSKSAEEVQMKTTKPKKTSNSAELPEKLEIVAKETIVLKQKARLESGKKKGNNAPVGEKRPKKIEAEKNEESSIEGSGEPEEKAKNVENKQPKFKSPVKGSATKKVSATKAEKSSSKSEEHNFAEKQKGKKDKEASTEVEIVTRKVHAKKIEKISGDVNLSAETKIDGIEKTELKKSIKAAKPKHSKEVASASHEKEMKSKSVQHLVDSDMIKPHVLTVVDASTEIEEARKHKHQKLNDSKEDVQEPKKEKLNAEKTEKDSKEDAVANKEETKDKKIAVSNEEKQVQNKEEEQNSTTTTTTTASLSTTPAPTQIVGNVFPTEVVINGRVFYLVPKRARARDYLEPYHGGGYMKKQSPEEWFRGLHQQQRVRRRRDTMGDWLGKIALEQTQQRDEVFKGEQTQSATLQNSADVDRVVIEQVQGGASDETAPTNRI